MFDLEMDAATLPSNEKFLKLEELVQEKDQLLRILSDRLEQAVEQLDRFRREGVQATFDEVKPARPGLADDEPDLRDDLRQMLDDWQSLQQRGWFEQLEQRLDSIHQSVTRGGSNTDSAPLSNAPSVEIPAKGAANTKDDSSSYTSSVADILQRFGGNEASKETVTANESKAIAIRNTAVVPAFGAPPSNRDSISDRMIVSFPESPDEIDVETADLATLKAAVNARNAYISQLEEYLQTMEATAQQPVEIPSLADLTDSQSQVLDSWSESMRKEFRQTQIQISLERAKLSRETMKLQHQQQLVESELKRLELARRATLIGSDDEVGGETAKPRGWKGLFGGK
jgi:hypothetical protein